ncbi:LysM peptidoglycan-binding domain-containing protein [Aliivibrio fischeri]
MKEWDKNIKQCDVSIESKKPKFIRAFYPWNEELAQQCKVEKTHYEPVKEKQEKAPAFEYSIEIACALDEFNTYQIGVFSLGKTKEEANISTWSKIQTEKGNTLLTASVNVDEPKILYREFFISSGSAMTFNNVKPVKKGTANAIDSFVPIKPSVQIYDLLSWPKIGFFYHFIDDVLVNEYQLAGGDKWSFKITHSKGKELSNELLSEHEYSFILLPWKINNTLVARQHLLYTKEKITQEQLSEISAKWLDDNARILNPDQIVEARTEKQVERKKDSVYIVQPGDIFSNIARKQGIKYQTLIDLNPQIKDIHLINPGDVIFIKEGERIPSTATVALSHHSSGDPKYDESSTSFDISTTCPVELNQSKTVFPFYNVWVSSNRHFTELAYMLAQEEKTIKGTTAIVNVKSIALQSKLLAISEKLESIAQGKKEIIKKGAKGNEVKLLQEALLKMKFNLGSAGADGDFGKGTHDAIIDFQTKFVPTHEIHPEYQIKEVDGIVGKSTLLGLDEAIAIGWERKIPPFKWHEPLLNPISTNYYQGGRQVLIKLMHGGYSVKKLERQLVIGMMV